MNSRVIYLGQVTDSSHYHNHVWRKTFVEGRKRRGSPGGGEKKEVAYFAFPKGAGRWTEISSTRAYDSPEEFQAFVYFFLEIIAGAGPVLPLTLG